MDKISLFIDETKTILIDQDVELEWLTKDYLSQVPNVEKYIGIFVKVYNGGVPKDKVKENFEIFRSFLNNVLLGNFKELLEFTFDPMLYMDTNELEEQLCAKLEEKLHKNESEVNSGDVSGIADLIQSLTSNYNQPIPPWKYGKHKRGGKKKRR